MTTALAGLDAETSRADALALARQVLAAAGLDEAALDARLLTLEALGISSVELLTRPELPIGQAAADGLAIALTRRMAREPVARILGEREFWGLRFRLAPETLVPRPDTETLVEAALSGVPDRQAAIRILDLGTGSGAILVALLHELPRAWGIGLDRSPAALATARENALINGVAARAAFVASDWTASLDGRFDLVVSNPPYIPAGAIAALDPEVARHDPLPALDGGPDGLDAYRAILDEAPRLLAPGGRLAFEIGYDQAEAVAALAAERGFAPPALRRDLAGRPRVLTFPA